jgi:hypothetical protein
MILGKKILSLAVVALPLAFMSTLTGCLTDDKKSDTTTTPNSTALGASTVLSAGAQAHPTLGSVLDLDSGKVWKSAVANANQEKIDLVFLNYGGAYYLHDAVSAKAAGVANGINLTDSYDAAKIKASTLVKVSTKPKDRETAKANYDAGTKVAFSVITGGEMFVVKSTEGALFLVTVGSVSGGAAGTGDFTVNAAAL